MYNNLSWGGMKWKFLVILFPVFGLLYTTDAKSAHGWLYEFEDFSPAYDRKNINISIPKEVGAFSEWMDPTSWTAKCLGTSTVDSSAKIYMRVNAVQIDSNTYATSNPGVGIQYNLDFNGVSSNEPTTTLDLETQPHCIKQGIIYLPYIHVQYRFIRLLNKIPKGKITLPSTTFEVVNGSGYDGSYNDASGFYSGYVLTENIDIPFTACTIDAPGSIQLPDLNSGDIKFSKTSYTGPTVRMPIELRNCPGGFESITYKITPGTSHPPADMKGLLETTGPSPNVYFRITKAGSGFALDVEHTLANYDGEGDYPDLADFNVGWYIHSDALSDAIEGNYRAIAILQLTYN
jgi:type 1 fimbria pilin